MQVAAELNAAAERVKCLEVRDSVVMVQMYDQYDVVDLATKMGMPRVVRNRCVVGFVYGVRVVLWHKVAARAQTEPGPTWQAHRV